MRYTEARLAQAAMAMVAEADEDTVDFGPNYDGQLLEPLVLPAAYPNLLVNGGSGIAVGMATNMAPHNLGEVIDACMAVIDNPEVSIDDLIDIIPGPDFPTGGLILGRVGIKSAFHTGRGSVVMRARVNVEEIRKDREALIVTEIPYQVNKTTLIEKIAELVREKRVEGISDDVPIVMAGGVWFLRDWNNWIDNPELGQIAFQLGTRPLLTQESPIPQGWKDALTKIPEDGVLLHQFSPTGFYSSAVINPFLLELQARSERQIAYVQAADAEHTAQLDVGVKGKNFWVTPADLMKAREWDARGFTVALKTPDNTLVFVTPSSGEVIRKDQKDCMGCLSHCGFSSWKDHDNNSTGRLADPRSFCIQKALQNIAHGAPIDENLMFAGHSAYLFGKDPFYSNGFVPTVKQLVDRILTGD